MAIVLYIIMDRRTAHTIFKELDAHNIYDGQTTDDLKILGDFEHMILFPVDDIFITKFKQQYLSNESIRLTNKWHIFAQRLVNIVEQIYN